MINVRAAFEDELLKRGYSFSVDDESGRHSLEIGSGRMLVSLENLQRDVENDGDAGRIRRFVDAIVASAGIKEDRLSPDQLFWCLEPSDYEERAEFRVAMSDRLDRVLVYVSEDLSLVTWVTSAMLETLGLAEAEAGQKALSNLALALSDASVECEDIDGVRVGFISTTLPFKAALVLAPNLREVVGPVLGWPLLAVIPDRDFLYLWPAQHKDFVQRLGGVVVREFAQASYPLSTEVFEISHEKIRAIGAFPTEA